MVSPPSCGPRFSLLHLVCGLGSDDVTEFLLGPKVGGDPNDADNAEGLTPLHAAAMAGSPGCIEILLENGEAGVGSELVPGLYWDSTPLQYFGLKLPKKPNSCLRRNLSDETGILSGRRGGSSG